MGLFATRQSRWNVPHPTDPSMTCNIHRRIMDGTIDDAAVLLASIGSDDDRLWPTWRWPALLLDNGLTVDSQGGHGSVRYRVAEVESHRVRCIFTSNGPFEGEHTFLIAEPAPGRVAWMHHLDVRSTLPPRLFDIVVKLHDGLIEDLFDSAHAQLSGKPLRPRPFSPSYALMQRVYRSLDKER